MAWIWFFSHFLPACFAASFPVPESSVINAAGVSHSQRAAGVFMFIEGEKYTFNFTSARAACLSLNVTMATIDQMKRALQQGLETCKFGWIAEQTAVIPRITANNNCGKGQTGLVFWSTSADRKFAVFCFNASDLAETANTPKAAPQTTSFSPTPPTALTQTPTQTTTEQTTATEEPKTTKLPEDTSSTSLLNLLAETARSTGIFSSSSTSPEMSSTHFPTSPCHPTSAITFASSTSESVQPHTESSARPAVGAVPTALIILGIILLLLAAAGVVWYYKLNLYTMWSLGQQKDDTETEMWKHTDSEMDIHSQHGAEEEDEESESMYSSDITLCVKADIKAKPTE